MRRKSSSKRLLLLALLTAMAVVVGCDDDDGTEADRLGIAATCTTNDDCNQDAGLNCLSNFKGGYCGTAMCTAHADCPDGSLCVAHDDGTNYCFRVCANKSECNRNRPADSEANCSSNIDWVEPPPRNPKACVPPSG